MHLKMFHYILRRVLCFWNLTSATFFALSCPGIECMRHKVPCMENPDLRVGSWMFLVWILVFSSMSLGQFKLFLEEIITSLCHYGDDSESCQGPCTMSGLYKLYKQLDHLVIIYWVLPILQVPRQKHQVLQKQARCIHNNASVTLLQNSNLPSIHSLIKYLLWVCRSAMLFVRYLWTGSMWVTHALSQKTSLEFTRLLRAEPWLLCCLYVSSVQHRDGWVEKWRNWSWMLAYLGEEHLWWGRRKGWYICP